MWCIQNALFMLATNYNLLEYSFSSKDNYKRGVSTGVGFIPMLPSFTPYLKCPATL